MEDYQLQPKEVYAQRIDVCTIKLVGMTFGPEQKNSGRTALNSVGVIDDIYWAAFHHQLL